MKQENIFKLINNKYYYLRPGKLSIFDRNNGCVARYTDISSYDLEKNNIIFSKDIHANYLLKEVLKDKEICNLLELHILKDEKLKKLDDDYKKSKKITIKNGKQIVINHDTPERKFFIKKIETYIYQVSASDLLSKISSTYSQDNLEISLFPIFWNKLFNLSFVKIIDDNISINIREKNGIAYNDYKASISQAKTLEEVNKILIDFINPNGTLINITLEAEKLKELLKGREDYNKLMSIIETYRGDDGKIHLIKEK